MAITFGTGKSYINITLSPRKLAGKDSLSNLVILHLICHQKVHSGPDGDFWKGKFLEVKGKLAPESST